MQHVFAEEVASDGVVVYVTEKVPGANCTSASGSVDNDPTKRLYECTIKRGFGGFEETVKGILKYVVFITLLFGVLMIVLSGMLVSLGGLTSEQRQSSKERIMQV